MDDTEYLEACHTLLEMINCERIEKNKPLLVLDVANDRFCIDSPVDTIISSENIQKLFYKLLGIVRYIQCDK